MQRPGAGHRFRSDGTLYAYADSCDQVGVINTSTGAFTLLGSTGSPDGGNGIAFSPGDVLFHAGGVNVGTLDQTTGVLTPGAALTFPTRVSLAASMPWTSSPGREPRSW